MNWSEVPNDLSVGAAILIVVAVVLTAMAFVEILDLGFRGRSSHGGTRKGNGP